MIGWGWLYALHARSCIARQKFWQAEYTISGMRDTALALACARLGLATAHGRGIDGLLPTVKSDFEAALVRHLDAEELSRAFRVVTSGLLAEIKSVDVDVAKRLEPALTELLVTERACYDLAPRDGQGAHPFRNPPHGCRERRRPAW